MVPWRGQREIELKSGGRGTAETCPPAHLHCIKIGNHTLTLNTIPTLTLSFILILKFKTEMVWVDLFLIQSLLWHWFLVASHGNVSCNHASKIHTTNNW